MLCFRGIKLIEFFFQANTPSQPTLTLYNVIIELPHTHPRYSATEVLMGMGPTRAEVPWGQDLGPLDSVLSPSTGNSSWDVQIDSWSLQHLRERVFQPKHSISYIEYVLGERRGQGTFRNGGWKVKRTTLKIWVVELFSAKSHMPVWITN